MTTRTAIYMGDIKHLQGQRAILRNVEPFNPDRVLAQFDKLDLTLSGNPIPKRIVLEYEPHARFPTEQEVPFEHPPKDCLAFGWHEFDQDDFLEYREL